MDPLKKAPRVRGDYQGRGKPSPYTPKEQADRSRQFFLKRVAQSYKALLSPCEKKWHSAMKYLEEVIDHHPEDVIAGKDLFVSQIDQFLLEPVRECSCTEPEDLLPSDSIRHMDKGRFRKMSSRIRIAQLSIESDKGSAHWQFFLDRVREVAPEMLSK